MKAVLAFFQGKFNNCNVKWISATECEISLVDNVNNLEGSFNATYDADKVMTDAQADAGMKPIKRVNIPSPTSPIMSTEGGP